MGTQPQPFPKWPLRAKSSNFRKRKCYFSSVFVRRPFRAKGSPPKFENRNFTSVLTFDVHFVRKGCAWHLKIAILPQFLTFDVHFVRKGFDWHLKIAILRQFLTFDVHFVRKGCDWHLKIAIFSWFSNGFSARNKAFFLTPKTFKFDTQIPSNRHHFMRIWNQSGTSREPVGKIRAPPQKASKMLKKACFCRVFSVFWSIFGSFRVVHGFSRLVPDWFPTGSKFVKSGAEICRSWCQILAVNLPNLRKNQNLENFWGFGRVFGDSSDSAGIFEEFEGFGADSLRFARICKVFLGFGSFSLDLENFLGIWKDSP